MAISPQTLVFGLQSIMRLGNVGRRAYQDGVLDDGIVLPDIDTASLNMLRQALQILRDAISDDLLSEAKWRKDYDLVNAEDTTAAGLAAQTRVIEIATRFDASFANDSEAAGLTVLRQWSSDANRQTPMGRIGIELADIALDYIGSNPSLFGADGNGARLIQSVASGLGDLLPDPDNPAAPGVNFASGAIRIFVEAGLRTFNDNIDDYLNEAHLQDVATSILSPLIEAVRNPSDSNQPWYNLRDEFLGPISAAAIEALSRNQVALLGDDFELDAGVGVITQSVLLSIKENGLQDDFGKEGVIRIYNSMLDAVINQPDVFIGDAKSKADQLAKALLVDASVTLKAKSPPFNKPLAVELVASTFETVSANAAALVPNINAEQWSGTVAGLSEAIIREISEGFAIGLTNGHQNLLQHLFNKDQAAELIHILVEEIASTPGLVVNGESAEARALVAIIARAMAVQNGQLFSAENWLDVTSLAAREVASNPGRLVKLEQTDIENQLLFKLIEAVLNAAAVAAEGGRAGGSVLFGPLLVEVLRVVVETAAGNAARALQNVARLQEFIVKLTAVTKTLSASMGKQEWLYLFRQQVAAVLDTGDLPDLDPETLLNHLLER